MKNRISKKKKCPFRQYLRISSLIAILLYGLVSKSIAVQSLADARQDIRINDIRVSVHFDDTPLDRAIMQISKQTDIPFNYNASLFAPDLRTSYQGKKVRLKTVLDAILPDNISFEAFHNGIILHAKKNVDKDFSVSGTVLDGETKDVLPGVNIAVKGTSMGTISNTEGHYSLTVPSENDTLIFSFVGYGTREVPIRGRESINISLQPKTVSGDEVVVVGYGEQKKSNLTESAAEVDGAELAQRPTANLSQSLQGKLPGLNVTKSSGQPGSDSKINIRGITSINGGSPLILIDGVEGDIDDVNPNDVESVTVLKDAAASAIYGARGSFGVVLVTTKEARSGKTQVSYTNNFAWQTNTANTDFVTDPYQSARLVDQAFQRSVGNSYTGYTEQDYEELKRRSEDPSLPDVVTDIRNGKEQYIYYGNTDWWNTMFRKWQPTQTHNISISGGNDRLSAYVSGRFYKNVGILKVQKDTYDKYNARGKIDFKALDWLTFSDNLYVNTSSRLTHGGSMYGWGNPWGSLIWVHALPSYAPTNPDGTATFRTELNNYTIGDGVFASLLYGKSFQQVDNQDLSNTIKATVTPLPQLEINADYTNKWFFYQESRRNTTVPWSIYPGEIDYLGNDQLLEARNNDTYNALNIYINSEQSLNNHHFKEIIGLNHERKKYGSISAYKRNSISDDLNALDLGTSDPEAYGSASEWVTQGYFFRVNYDYDGRYLLEANGRYDGTSRFPQDHRWGFFPSVSAGWLVSDEAFMDGLRNTISELKLRASYGSLGNQQVNTYAYTPTLNKGTANYLVGGSRLEYINPPGLNPRSITWEKVNTANLGLDLSLFRNTVTANVDLFQRKTIGMLTQGKTLPAVLGTASPRENAADLRTRGFELQLTYQNSFQLADKPIQLTFSGSVSNQVTNITRFDNPNNFLGDYYVGQEIGEIWGYHVDGLFQSDEEAANHADQSRVNSRINSSPGEFGKPLAGDVKYVDMNGDGVIDNGDNTLENPGDRQIIGNAAPKFPYSFSVRANWNNIDFSTYFQGIGQQDWYPNTDSRLFWAMYCRPYASFQRKDLVNDIWAEDNTDAYFPRLRGYTALNGDGELGTVNDRYLQSVAYLRLKNLTIGYTLPTELTQKLHARRIRFYVSGENLLTFSSLTDYIDPEAASNAFNFAETSSADDRSTAQAYPFSKIYSFGINIDF